METTATLQQSLYTAGGDLDVQVLGKGLTVEPVNPKILQSELLEEEVVEPCPDECPTDDQLRSNEPTEPDEQAEPTEQIEGQEGQQARPSVFSTRSERQAQVLSKSTLTKSSSLASCQAIHRPRQP